LFFQIPFWQFAVVFLQPNLIKAKLIPRGLQTIAFFPCEILMKIEKAMDTVRFSVGLKQLILIF